MEMYATNTSHDMGNVKVSPLEPFLVAARTVEGEDAVRLIIQILEASNVFVFGEFFDCPNIAILEGHPEYQKYYNLLKLFAYDTYSTYQRNASNLPELSESMEIKMKLLTIVSLATHKKKLLISDIGKEIGLSSNRQIEDIIIEALSAGLITGKIDQKNGRLEVDFVVSRDVKLEDLSNIAAKLEEWCKSCDGVLSTVEQVIDSANNHKKEKSKHRIDLEEDIYHIKSNMKSTPEGDESMVTESSDREKRRITKKGKDNLYKLWPKNS